MIENYKRGFSQNAFSVFELMAVLMVTMILVSTAYPLFTAYQLRSKTTEAIIALQSMVNGEARHYMEHEEFVVAGPINMPPSARSIVVNFDSDPNWAILGFGITAAIYFGYETVLNSPTEVDCRAVGDLDDDGVTSLFQRLAQASGQSVTIGPLFVFDEIE